MRDVARALVIAVVAGCGSSSTTVDATATDAAIDAAIDAPPVCVPACGAHAACTGTTCACEPGYTGDGQTCTDVDECMAGNGGCDVNATCTNTDGSRTCACVDGYLGDGVSCHPIWQRVATFATVTYDGSLEPLSAAAGAALYFANDRGIGTSFFRRFDTTNNQLSAPLATTDSEFCQCGNGQQFFGSGSTLYMFGNAGSAYEAVGDTWTALGAYTATAGRGEAGGATDPATGRMYAVGGRDSTGNYVGSAIAIATTGAITSEPGAAPFGWRRPAAYIPPGTSFLYAAGGAPDDNNVRHLVRHTLGQATWDVMADAPGDLSPDRGMGHASATLLWVGTDAGLYLYDTSSSTWRPTPLAVPPHFQRAISAAGQVWAITSASTTGIEIYKLLATE